MPKITHDVAWQDALDEFLLLKQSEGRAERTIRDYRYHVGRFFDAHADAWPHYPKLKKAVLEFFTSLQGMSATSFNLYRQYLKTFFAWCVEEGYLPKNPIDGIKKRKNDGKPRSVDMETIKKLLKSINTKTYAGLRDYCLILFQLDTGIRPGEALQLLPEHFNLKALEAVIPETVAKTRTARTVIFSPQTGKAIQKLLAVRPKDWTDDVPVFASENGTRMSVDTWGNRLSMYHPKIGCKVTPYMLRHTSAIMFLRGGGHVFALQRQLGHASLVMTKRYVHLADSDLHEQHAIASPVGQLMPQRTRIRKVR